MLNKVGAECTGWGDAHDKGWVTNGLRYHWDCNKKPGVDLGQLAGACEVSMDQYLGQRFFSGTPFVGFDGSGFFDYFWDGEKIEELPRYSDGSEYKNGVQTVDQNNWIHALSLSRWREGALENAELIQHAQNRLCHQYKATKPHPRTRQTRL